MKLYDGGASIALILIGIAVLCGLASNFYFEEDNPIEEASEEIIESQTGVDIDLTPNSPEN